MVNINFKMQLIATKQLQTDEVGQHTSEIDLEKTNKKNVLKC